MKAMPSPRLPRCRQAIATQALDLIDVEYEVLPFVIDVEAAMAPDAPILHDDLFTAGVDAEADQAIQHRQGCHLQERRRRGRLQGGGRDRRRPLHHAAGASGLYRAACLPATYAPDGQITIHASSQGHFMIRAYTAKLLGIDIANIRVNPAEIGGGFGGKTLIYLEPVAVMLSKKSGRPGEDSDDARGGVPRLRSDLGCDRSR